MTLPIFDEIVKTANEVGIPYSGHVSIDVGVRHALESKYASIDHVDGYVEGLSIDATGVDPNENGFFGINFTDIADRDLISELVKLTGDNDVWIVPTQSLMERWVGPKDATILGSEEAMKYMSPQTIKRWVDTKIAYTSRADYSKDKAQRFVDLRAEIINSLNEGGVGILLGSDAPQVFNVPGFSIQNELESMVKSGLSNYEALESGTANPAKFFDAVGLYGSIVVGSSADFILLTNNPLESISNTRNQLGVMVQGKWLSSEYIEERLNKIADKYEAQKE